MAQQNSIVSGVAARYATALFELARDAKQIDAVGDALKRFDTMVTEMPDLARFVRSPTITGEEKVKALGPVLQAAGITGITANFLKLVASQHRLFFVQDMIRSYAQQVDAAKGVRRAEVTVAEQPSDKALADIAAALKQVAGEKVAFDLKIDPAIIGGIIVKLGSKMVDASLRTRLNGIRIAMKEVG